jgi:Fic-DOC domain mobile mystery protein B
VAEVSILGGDDPPGATPLGPSEVAGLRPAWVTTRAELDEAEQANILAGQVWASRTRRRDLLTDSFVRALHKAMFGEVWRWAGTYRTRETNIGVLPYRIPEALKECLETARFWLETRPFPEDEIAVLVHHRLVQIHPFPNGNGRHTRLMADLVAEQLGRQPFTWGRISLVEAGPTRATYIAALRAADDHDVRPLLAFARS